MSDDLVKRLRGWDCLEADDCGDAIRDEAAVRIERLEAERRDVVSHATMGHSTGEGMSLNDVCVEISRRRNVLIEDYRTRVEALEAENKRLRKALERLGNLTARDAAIVVAALKE